MSHSCPSGLSFVICCYNSGQTITKVLENLSLQKNAAVPFEIIIVDNNCTDNTAALARLAWKRSDVPLSVIQEPQPGLSFARKKGVEHARYGIISFIDDDNYVEENWIAKVYRLFQSMPGIGAVGGRNIPVLPPATPFWFENNMHHYACGPQLERSGLLKGERKYLFGAGLSMRTCILKEILFSAVPLFSTDRIGESVGAAGGDAEMCFRCLLLGWDLWYEQDLTLKHFIPAERLSWPYFCRMNEGFGFAFPILECYFLKLNEDLGHLTFSRILLRRILKFIRCLLQYNFRLIGEKEGAFYQKEFYFLKGWFKGYWRVRKSVPNMTQQIEEKFCRPAKMFT